LAGLGKQFDGFGTARPHHRLDATTPQHLAAFARDLVETHRTSEILRDARTDFIHESEIRAAHEQTALAGSLEEHGGTRGILGDRFSELVHEAEDVAGLGVTVIAGLLVQADRVLGGDRTRQKAEEKNYEQRRSVHVASFSTTPRSNFRSSAE
jgi:hypothetical protein